MVIGNLDHPLDRFAPKPPGALTGSRRAADTRCVSAIPWYEQMWTPARDAMEDEWHAAESSFVCGLLGSLLTMADGRAGGIGMGLLAFAIVIGVNGLWIAWWNRYTLGGILATLGIYLGVIRVPEAVDALRQVATF